MTTFRRLPSRLVRLRPAVGPLLVVAALVLAVIGRLVPAAGPQLPWLPLVAVALLPTLRGGGPALVLGIGLSILAGLAIAPGEDAVGQTVDALLLAGVGLGLGDLARRVRGGAPEPDLRLGDIWRLHPGGEMVAILAHQLHQPLTAATTYLQAGRADLARAQLDRCGRMVHQMRDMLAPASRGQVPVRVSALIRSLDPVLDLIRRERSVILQLRVDDRCDSVHADGIQIQQAILNLVRNAVDSMSGQDVREVIISGKSVPDQRYEIAVSDRGAGFTPDHLERMSRPLTSPGPDHTGLGLPVTRSIVEAHGGTLAMRPSEGGGSTLHFTLRRSGDGVQPA